MESGYELEWKGEREGYGWGSDRVRGRGVEHKGQVE